MWEGKPLGPNALLDEAEHKAFLERELPKLRAIEQPVRSPAPRADVVTNRQLGKLLEEAGKLIGQAIREATARLEKRIAEIERTSMGKYCGTWQKDADYFPGNFVTAGGSLWHCKERTGTRPGTNPEAWTLVAKRGRDAR